MEQFANNKERESAKAKNLEYTPIPYSVDPDTFDMTPEEKLPLDHYCRDQTLIDFVKSFYDFDKDWVFWGTDCQDEVDLIFSPPYSYETQQALGLLA